MKSKTFIPSKSNSIEGQFTSLNNNEMTNLKGGTNPPLPPGGGEDYPIDILKSCKISAQYNSVQLLPKL